MAKRTTTNNKGASAKSTPPLSTYDKLKARYPDTILLMKVGDIFECYGADAVLLNKITGLTLAKTDAKEICGFPHTQLDTYLPRVIRAGYRVAVCERLEQK